MNTPTPNPRRPDPLTPEERALAGRLARLGPHDGPSPALDTKILAAAHAAAAQHNRPADRRWPALLGIAATLALAIGVAWQLRPMPQAPAVQDEAPRGAVVMSTATDQAAGEAAMAPAADAAAASARVEPPDAPAPQSDQATPLAADAETATVARAVPPAVSANAAAEPIATDAPAATANAARRPRGSSALLRAIEPAATAKTPPALPVAAPPGEPTPSAFPAQSAAPSPPVAPAAPATRAAEPAAGTSAKTMNRRSYAAPTAQESRAAADATQAESSRDQFTASDSLAADPPAAHLPETGADRPVAADYRLEPAAWLQRIRQRRDAGDLAGARDSLAEFRRVHPHVAIPDDLRALANRPPDR